MEAMVHLPILTGATAGTIEISYQLVCYIAALCVADGTVLRRVQT
jgi:hypothetical protein